MKTIDSRGRNCPLPVIDLKKALKDNENESLRQLVDNEITKQIIEKMLVEKNIEYKVTKDNTDFIIDINPNETEITVETGVNIIEDVLVISTDKMGTGDDELGILLMKNFLYALTESEGIPKKIVIYNAGVKLACIGHEALEDLLTLEKMGVEILVCGLCLNFYKMTEQLGVGTITNMYSIVEAKLKAKKLIRL